MIRDILTTIGEHFWLILILLAELLFAVVLVCSGFRRKSGCGKEKKSELPMTQFSFHDVQEAVLILRTDDQLPVGASDNFETLFGTSYAALCADVSLLNQLDVNQKLFQQYRKWDGTAAFSYDFQLPGQERWFCLNVIRDKAARRDLFLFHEITTYKNACFALEEQMRKIEKESFTKSQFLSRMSHEIRTPMNGIIGMLSLTKKQCSQNPKALEYLGEAENLSQYLLSIINDILDLSRIEAGKLELEEKPLDLRSIANKLRNMFQETVEAKNVRFSVTFQDFDTYYVIADDIRLCQVLTNLVSNAVKFTAKGEITVTFQKMLQEKERMDFLIKVHDTGIGIEPAFLEKIFLPFEQESRNITKKYGGSGLGMAITDNIVRIMGGTIVINSMPGNDSDFNVFLSLPLATEEQIRQIPVEEMPEEVQESADYTFAGKQILLAEDNEINAEIAVDILEEEGASVDVAGNGKIAVEMFENSPVNHYDLILMDVQMPERNGREAASDIRRLDRADAKTVLIFALSADAYVEDKRLSRSYGMDGHFAKPVDFQKMKTEIGEIIRQKKR